MKKVRPILLTSLSLAAILFMSGCVAAIGNRNPNATVGQQLVDLQKAKEAGALTETEFQIEKARLLGNK